MKFNIELYYIIIYLCIFFMINAQINIVNIEINSKEIPIYSKFEISFVFQNETPGNFIWNNLIEPNPYIPENINVSAVFNAADNSQTFIYCFLYQSYNMSETVGSSAQFTTIGYPVWKCRFTPTIIGQYNYTINFEDYNNNQATTTGQFNAISSSLPGFVRISSTDSHYFIRENVPNVTFFPVGENVAWASGPIDFEKYIQNISMYGGNLIRVWKNFLYVAWPALNNYGYSNTSINPYFLDQQHTWTLDYIFDICVQYNMTVLFSLYNTWDWVSAWDDSLWNSERGGPLNQPNDVWNTTSAQYYFNLLYRYFGARYGYATTLFAWEFWNEVDGFGGNPEEMANWHTLNREILRSFDPNKHLVTTSTMFHTMYNEPLVYRDLDFTQQHLYGWLDFPNAAHYANSMMLGVYPNKPTVVGEFGTTAGQDAPYYDLNGTNIHNMNWASLMTGAACGSLTWWWYNYVKPYNLYHQFRGVPQFTANEKLESYNYKPIITDDIIIENLNSNMLVDIIITPLNGSWTPPPSPNYYNVTFTNIFPNETVMMTTQFSNQQSNIRYPPHFFVDVRSNNTKFIANISYIDSAMANFTITLDNITIFEKILPGSNDLYF
jgi:hypothetical protein